MPLNIIKATFSHTHPAPTIPWDTLHNKTRGQQSAKLIVDNFISKQSRSTAAFRLKIVQDV